MKKTQQQTEQNKGDKTKTTGESMCWQRVNRSLLYYVGSRQP